ncbi:hypothetical protein DFJ73DRAFT_35938 [Zopfochytrium polystomum]|nr:hypothetical protein DFJ73DRAFT_35938 [Zopfochytrium polystomum]
MLNNNPHRAGMHAPAAPSLPSSSTNDSNNSNSDSNHNQYFTNADSSNHRRTNSSPSPQRRPSRGPPPSHYTHLHHLHHHHQQQQQELQLPQQHPYSQDPFSPSSPSPFAASSPTPTASGANFSSGGSGGPLDQRISDGSPIPPPPSGTSLHANFVGYYTTNTNANNNTNNNSHPHRHPTPPTPPANLAAFRTSNGGGGGRFSFEGHHHHGMAGLPPSGSGGSSGRSSLSIGNGSSNRTSPSVPDSASPFPHSHFQSPSSSARSSPSVSSSSFVSGDTVRRTPTGPLPDSIPFLQSPDPEFRPFPIYDFDPRHQAGGGASSRGSLSSSGSPMIPPTPFFPTATASHPPLPQSYLQNQHPYNYQHNQSPVPPGYATVGRAGEQGVRTGSMGDRSQSPRVRRSQSANRLNVSFGPVSQPPTPSSSQQPYPQVPHRMPSASLPSSPHSGSHPDLAGNIRTRANSKSEADRLESEPNGPVSHKSAMRRPSQSDLRSSDSSGSSNASAMGQGMPRAGSGGGIGGQANAALEAQLEYQRLLIRQQGPSPKLVPREEQVVWRPEAPPIQTLQEQIRRRPSVAELTSPTSRTSSQATTLSSVQPSSPPQTPITYMPNPLDSIASSPKGVFSRMFGKLAKRQASSTSTSTAVSSASSPSLNALVVTSATGNGSSSAASHHSGSSGNNSSTRRPSTQSARDEFSSDSVLYVAPSHRKVSGSESRGTFNPSIKSGDSVRPELLIAAEVNYKTLSPEDAAVRLFHLTITGLSKEDVCNIIGTGDDFHLAILQQYMKQFDFLYADIDIALRRLTSHLYLVGESQKIDRILHELARRYWECNPDANQIYRSAEVVYGILFSIVLLNTDLHVVNVGANKAKRMEKKDFIKNTFVYIDQEIEQDPVAFKELNSIGAGYLRSWRKDMENLLENLYKSVKDNRILLQAPAPATEADPTDDARPSRAANSAPNSDNRRPSATRTNSVPSVAALSIAARLAHSQSDPSVPPVPQLHSAAPFSPPQSPPPSASLNPPNENSLHSRTSFSGSELSGGIASGTSTHPSGSRTGSSSQRRARRGLGRFRRNVTSGVAMEGLLIRKHVQEKEGVRAKVRKWTKMWAVLAIDEVKGVELTLFKVEGGLQIDGEVGFDEVETAVSVGKSETRKMVLKISNDPPQVHNLLHASAFALKPPGHSPSRPFVINLTLSNGAIYLLQTPTSEFLLEWTKTINYWAARKSKEPMRGAISSAEYGWGDAAWERMEQERLEREGGSSGNGGGLLESFGGRRRNVKIEEWNPPPASSTLVSELSEESQLASMRKVADVLSRELEEHASYKQPMEARWASNPSALAKARSNWTRKERYLTQEYLRFAMYAQILRSSVNLSRYDEISIISASSSTSSSSPRGGGRHRPRRNRSRSGDLPSGSTDSGGGGGGGARTPSTSPQPHSQGQGLPSSSNPPPAVPVRFASSSTATLVSPASAAGLSSIDEQSPSPKHPGGGGRRSAREGEMDETDNDDEGDGVDRDDVNDDDDDDSVFAGTGFAITNRRSRMFVDIGGMLVGAPPAAVTVVGSVAEGDAVAEPQ